jgi:signal transduction histidine kinase
VRVPRAQLLHALLEVARNGLEVPREAGELRLSVKRDSSGTIVEVEDDGPGMTAAVLERAFEFQFTTREGAAGIGLSVARSLIDRLGGRLALESRPGEGTRARIVLPTPPDQD